jgi:hypothetical protein
MASGVSHSVFSLTPECLVVGGHFYALEMMKRTLWSGVQEHLRGQTNTNTEHPGSEEVLYRAAKKYTREKTVQTLLNDGAPLGS